MMDKNKIEIVGGQRWELPCPFYREESDIYGHRWRPGTYETAHTDRACEGMGQEVRDVVAVALLPKPYQTRVFYKRFWVTPGEYTFGRDQLNCIALPSFNAWRRRGPSWNHQWSNGGAKLIENDGETE